MTPKRACRTCWFSGMEPKTEADAWRQNGAFRWTCVLDRRPKKPPYVCNGHAPDQERAPTYREIEVARAFR
jgi:hypothetical protein